MTSGLFRRAHQVVARIPRGKVATYGQIALHLGLPRGARTVGWALSQCPAHLAWHRVVNVQGGISARSGSLRYGLQRERLEEEGVVFDASGRVDLDQFGWDGI